MLDNADRERIIAYFEASKSMVLECVSNDDRISFINIETITYRNVEIYEDDGSARITDAIQVQVFKTDIPIRNLYDEVIELDPSFKEKELTTRCEE